MLIPVGGKEIQDLLLVRRLDGEITTGGWPRADGLDLLDRLFADQGAAGGTDASEPR